MNLRLITGTVRNGWAAIAAGVLLMLSLGIELIHPVQERDGTVVEPVTSAVLVALWGLGMLCVAATVFHVRALHQEAAVPLSRAGRAGVRLAVAGSMLQVLFAIVFGLTQAVTGKGWEAAFVAFALGFLFLVIGGVLLGLGVRRAGVLRSAGAPLWVGAAAAVVAIALMSPWHDIALFAYAGTWVALGLILLRHRRRSLTSPGHRVPAAQRVSPPIQAISSPVSLKRVATMASVVALAATLVPSAGANGTGPGQPEGVERRQQVAGAIRHAGEHAIPTSGWGGAASSPTTDVSRGASGSEVIARNFEVLGHEDLGLEDSNGDVWVHGNFAYIGTFVAPCSGRGVKIVDVSNLREPEMIGTLAGRAGTSAEDMVVRTVSTESFEGDLLAVGIQGPCSEEAEGEDFGLELWDVSNIAVGPPVKLGEIALSHGEGGVHEVDLFQRGSSVYALVATPFSEFFDPVPGGDFRIIDVTNPRVPVQVGEWGAFAHSLTPGPFFGQGSRGATFGHSARVSADGMKAYVSYEDIGVLTLDISDVTDPTLLTRTRYPKGALDDGEAHSVSEYFGERGHFLLQNDEDFDPRSPADIRFPGGRGIGNESHHAAPLWLEPEHRVEARVVRADNQGCNPGDYPANTAGKIVVVKFPFPFFDPGFVAGVSEEPFCFAQQQEAAAAAAGAVAVVHDFVAESTSPQFLDFEDFGPVDIPALFTDHATAQGIVAAGKAQLRAQRPTSGFLRVFDSATGKQVAEFDKAPNVGTLAPPEGFWSIHNTEVAGDHAYSSWYTNGIVALDLRPLNDGDVENPKMVGQFVPTAGGVSPFPSVWGVAIRRSDNVIFASDEGSGLWIVRPTGKAAPLGVTR